MFPRRSLLGLLLHPCFLLVTGRRLVQDRTELDVEDVWASEAVREVFNDYRLYNQLLYTYDLRWYAHGDCRVPGPHDPRFRQIDN